MKHISELQEQMSQVFKELRAGQIKREDAAELANIAGKIIGIQKTQLGYHMLRSEAPDMPFLAATSAMPIAAEGTKRLPRLD